MAARPVGSTGILTTARPTLRGWCLAIAGGAGLAGAAVLGRSDLLFIGLFLVLAPLTALVILGRERPHWEVRRSFGPDIVEAGETVHDVITVRNLDERPVPAAVWRLTVPEGLRGETSGAFPRLDPFSFARSRGDNTVLRRRVVAERRGSYEVGPVSVRRTDPFGLVFTEWLLASPRTLLVTPRVTALEWGHRESELEGGLDHELLSFALPNADEVGVREYRNGDPLRRVHWNATARHGELMVRQEDRQSGPNAWLLFDTQPAQAHSGEHAAAARATFEKAVELVASLGTALLAHGFTVGVAETATTAGGVEFFDTEGGQHRFARELALAERSRHVEVDGVPLLAGQVRRSGRAAPVLVVLVSADPRVADLTELRRVAAPPLAFLLGEAHVHEAALRSDGWACVVIEDETDVGEAWNLLRGGSS